MKIKIPEYQIKEEIFRSNSSIIYRGIREQDETPVVIKTLANEYPSNHELMRFKHEFYITNKMKGNGMVQAHAQVKYGNNLALILEDFQGQAFAGILKQKTRIDLKLFLRLAIEISESLGRIHQQNVIHKDMNPRNILFNHDTKAVQIIDFGISTELTRELQDVNVTNQLEGSLAYISPEQTGRMNRELDYRTDYYSLGVTFYEILTGSLPFKAEDTIGWIHCHIAKNPSPPHEMDSTIPKALSDIVMKLMAKNAEDRYQGSIGLMRDLQECLQQLEQKNTIENFEPGRWDISEKFQIPQKLFGREKELETLLNAFENVAEGGAEYLLVSGYSGVGKSALVHEVHKPIVREKGYFVAGKFDQFQRDIPYSAFVQTFQDLVKQLLTETDERLARWKNILLEALHSNGQIIIDLIPEVERIIGKQKPVQELGPLEAQNRFFIAFKNFIQVFARKEHPLVIFLDDLQWSDIPTLKLIEYLMISKEMSFLFLIGAYRSNEVKEGHPLAVSLDEIQKVTPLNHIFLQPLNELHVNQLISETVHCDSKTATPLSELVSAKTQGNPFFVGEMLKNLYQEDAFNFCRDDGRWEWNLEKISQMEVTDNVVDLMLQRLKKLTIDAQTVLRFAACIGSVFDLKTLALIHGQSLADTGEILLPAIKEGLVIPLNAQYRLVHLQEENKGESDFGVSYKFQHDRVQQAAYSLLEENERKELHLKIARLLQKHASTENPEEKLIDIVRHFNEAQDLVTDAKDRKNLCILNLQASKKAKKSNAIPPALEYLKIAKKFLNENAWSESYDLCFEVHKEYSETAFLNGDMVTADEFVKILLRESKTDMEKATIYRMRLIHYTGEGRLHDAVDAGIQGLSFLSIEIAKESDPAIIPEEIGEVQKNLGGRSVESLIDQPLMDNPEMKIALRIMLDLTAPAFVLGLENFLGVIILKQVNIALRFGNSPEAAYAYSAYTILLNGALQDFKNGNAFGELAIKVNEKLDDLEFRCKIYHMYATFVHGWNHHWQSVSPLFKKTIEIGQQTGELLYSGFAYAYIAKWDSDLNLPESAKLGEESAIASQVTKNYDAIEWGIILQQYRYNLMGRLESRLTLDGPAFDADKCLAGMWERNSYTGIGILLEVKLQIHCMYEEFEKGALLIPDADKVENGLGALLFSTELCFYTFMTYAGAWSGMDEKEKEHVSEHMQKRHAQMKKWHAHFPVNTEHMVHMMDAELARIGGDSQAAILSLEQAIEAADKNEFLKYKALANELLGKLYISLNKTRIAGLYMSDAYYDYQVWGATGKLEFMKEKYGAYIQIRSSQSATAGGTVSTRTATTSGGEFSLDMSTVAKAAQTISGEVVLEKLLTKLMEIVQENAGAEKAILLLAEGKDLLIQAKSVPNEKVAVLISEKPEDSSQLSLGIVKYVVRSLENVVLDEATRVGNFINDPYIQKQQSKSVLCMPIMNHGVLAGALYLENNIASHAFTPDRLEVLQILASQAAISLENASLYSNLEDKVKERTSELEQAHQKILLLEKDATEKQMAGGFAHEIRNAMAGSSLLLERLLDVHSKEPNSYCNREINHLRFIFGHLKPLLSKSDMETVVKKMSEMNNLQKGMNKNLDIIYKSTKRCLAITNLIMEYSSIESGKTLREKVKIDEMLRSICDEREEEFLQQGVIIHYKNTKDIVFAGNALHFHSIVMNLILNARDALIDPKVSAERKRTIQIEGTTNDGDSVLRIRDNGVGIKKEDISRIYDAFYSTKPNTGTGLGLGMVKKYVSLYKGQIEVESEPGKGTSFILSFPRYVPN